MLDFKFEEEKCLLASIPLSEKKTTNSCYDSSVWNISCPKQRQRNNN